MEGRFRKRTSGTKDCVSFARTRLPVREQCRVVSLVHALEKGLTDGIKRVVLIGADDNTGWIGKGLDRGWNPVL